MSMDSRVKDVTKRIIKEGAETPDELSWAKAILTDFVTEIQTDERDRCANIATAVFMNKGTCKFQTEQGKGWNQACWDIHHRITNPDGGLTQSPGPAMIQALQAVKHAQGHKLVDGTYRINSKTLALVIDALNQFKNPKDL